MLPSISSGRYGIVSEPVYSSNSVHEINEVNDSLPDSFVDKDQAWPSLPLISEGSFTSLVSKQSGKSLERGRERATKNKEVNSSRQGLDIQRSGLKITQLQLNCQMKNLDRGWCAQGINPRLVNSSRSCQLPTMGFHVMSTAERLIFEQSLGQPVESLHKMKHQAAVESRKNQMKLGGQTIINKGYRMPVISRVVSPSKPSAPAMPSHAPEANHVNLNSKASSKPISSVAIHSRCCCRHHKQGNDQKATLKSRSSDSLTKERVSIGKKEGSVINQNIHGNTFSGEKRVKPTDRPPPKKLPSPSGFIVGQPRRKSKRVNVLASDSSSSIQEERKRVKKSVPKQTKQKRLKSPEHKSAEILPTSTDPAEESTKELMICVEDATQISVFEDKSKEPEELMEVECLDEEKQSYNREQPDSLDVISVRSATTCDPRRSATPRLLKVASEVKTDPTLAKVFQKLDTDCDGHISFAELKKSLPTHLSSHQIKYLKKIYDMACESTFFGLEEFTATHHMCSLLTNSSPVVSHAMSNLDFSTMEDWLTAFMESFAKSDKQQSGVIDLPSFVKMLASVVNVHPDSFVIQKILDNLGKSKDDTISGVELLAFIPYLVAVAAKDKQPWNDHAVNNYNLERSHSASEFETGLGTESL